MEKQRIGIDNLCLCIVRYLLLFFLLIIIGLSIWGTNGDLWPSVFGNVTIKIAFILLLAWISNCLYEVWSLIDRSNHRNTRWLLISLIIILLTIQFTMVSIMQTSFTWDNARIYECALSYVRGTDLLVDFLSMYPHQVGASMETVGLLHIMQLLGISEEYFVIGLNYTMVLFTDFSLLIMALTVKELFEKEKTSRVVQFLVCFALISPTITIWGAHYYPTILSLPFFSLAIYGFVGFIKTTATNKKAYCKLILGSLMAFVGYYIRATVLIVVIAFWIVLLFQGIKKEVGIKKIVVAMCTQIVCWLIILGAWTVSSSKFCPDRNPSLEFPMLNWVLIGVEDGGRYNHETALQIASIDGYDAKEAHIIDSICQRVEAKGIKGMLALYKEKLYTMWGEGDRDIHSYFSQSNNYTKIHSWIVGSENGMFKFYCQIVNVLFFFFVLAGGLSRRKKQWSDCELFLTLILLGNFIFYLIWEVQGHYNLSIEPLKLMLVAVYADDLFIRYKDKFDTKRGKNIRGAICLTAIFFVALIIVKTYPTMVNRVVKNEDVVVYQELGTMKLELNPNESYKQGFSASRPFTDIFLRIKNTEGISNDVEYDISLISDVRGVIWTEHIIGSEMPVNYYYAHTDRVVVPNKGENFSILISAGKGTGQIELYTYQLEHFNAYQNGDLQKINQKQIVETINADLQLLVTNVTCKPMMSWQGYLLVSALVVGVMILPIILWRKVR